MKIKALLSTLLCITTVSAMAQLPVEVKGLFKKKRISAVKLFKVKYGKSVEIANATPSANGQFGFLFYPEYEGLYLIGTGNESSPNDNYKFYFKGGEQLSVNLLDSSYVLTGKLNSKENVVLTQWHDLTFPLEQKAINFMRVQSTFVDYFPEQEEIVAKTKTFLNGKTTGNARFDKEIKTIMNWDLANYATNFLNTPRSAHPSVEEYSNFYSSIKAEDFSRTADKVYNYPWGLRTLTAIISVNMRQQNKAYKRGVEGVDVFTSFVPNDTLKGDIALDNAAGYKTINDYQALMAKYDKYIITKAQKERSNSIMSPLLTYKPGTEAYNFSYPDKNGKTVSMADLKGKVVLIDMWATWCGPCKAEIPYLKKLEEEMKGTDVAFVSVSVDEAKDKEKWLKMIETENLGGTQLFATGWSDMAKYYKVTGIPRFMVFDKQGKIVTVDSPRPSNPELKALLQKTLAN